MRLFTNYRKSLKDDIQKLKSKYHRSEIRTMPVTIPFTDGFGISLRKIESSMIRLPFIKGLIAYCPRRKFIDWCSANSISIHKVTDIYGKQYSINEIDYIFTKSQFKMWKYYNNVFDDNGNLVKTGWEVYKENFKKYNCDACRCNVERGVKLNSKDANDIIGLVYNADVPMLTDELGNTYKGITSDPRNIKFPAGTPVNVWLPSKGAEIAMTEVAGTESAAKYVVYKANDMKPTYAQNTTGALLAFKITGKKFVSIGSERVPTVEMIRVDVASA